VTASEKAHMLRCASSSSLRRTRKVRLAPRISRALPPGLFAKPSDSRHTVKAGIQMTTWRIPDQVQATEEGWAPASAGVTIGLDFRLSCEAVGCQVRGTGVQT
jgi:hypothetical protein